MSTRESGQIQVNFSLGEAASMQDRLLEDCHHIFISRLPERHKSIELATIKEQNSRKKTVRNKNTKSNTENMKIQLMQLGLNQTITATQNHMCIKSKIKVETSK